MAGPLIIFTAIAGLFTILQSNVLAFLSFHDVLPDLSFIVLAYFSFMYGTMSGQISGFASGLVFDFVSLSPFGFNAFVRTVCGHVIGRFKGAILLDAILLPMALVASSLIVKVLVVVIISPIIGMSPILVKQFSLQGLIEFLFTIIVSPLVFWPLRIIHNLIQSRRAYR